jgi:replicative DNA helicase
MTRSIFISYSHEDEALKNELLVHLSALKREGLVDVWHDRLLRPGQKFDGAIEEQIAAASVILLLVSAPFINSDYCAEKEMVAAFERSRKGDAIVISIILRPCQWASIPLKSGDNLGAYMALPQDARAVTKFDNRDEAWDQIVVQLRKILMADGTRERTDQLSGIIETLGGTKKLLSGEKSEQCSHFSIVKPFEEHLVAAVEAIESRANGDKRINFGFCELDSAIGGLRNSQLAILAARPNMERTSLAASVALNAANQELSPGSGNWPNPNSPVLLFSLGLSSEELSLRFVAQKSNVPLIRTHRAHFTDKEWERFVIAVSEIAKTKLILGTDLFSYEDIERATIEQHKKTGLRLVVIDDLQCIDDWSYDSKDGLVHIVRKLKNLASKLRVPILISMGLSNVAEDRHDKRPFLADLGEFGPIADFANVVLFLHREAPYVVESEPDYSDLVAHQRWMVKLERVFAEAEVLIAKSPSGETPRVRLNFDQSRALFTDVKYSLEEVR